jgi:hypothetical protein
MATSYRSRIKAGDDDTEPYVLCEVDNPDSPAWEAQPAASGGWGLPGPPREVVAELLDGDRIGQVAAAIVSCDQGPMLRGLAPFRSPDAPGMVG